VQQEQVILTLPQQGRTGDPQRTGAATLAHLLLIGLKIARKEGLSLLPWLQLRRWQHATRESRQARLPLWASVVDTDQAVALLTELVDSWPNESLSTDVARGSYTQACILLSTLAEPGLQTASVEAWQDPITWLDRAIDETERGEFINRLARFDRVRLVGHAAVAVLASGQRPEIVSEWATMFEGDIKRACRPSEPHTQTKRKEGLFRSLATKLEPYCVQMDTGNAAARMLAAMSSLDGSNHSTPVPQALPLPQQPRIPNHERTKTRPMSLPLFKETKSVRQRKDSGNEPTDSGSEGTDSRSEQADSNGQAAERFVFPPAEGLPPFENPGPEDLVLS